MAMSVAEAIETRGEGKSSYCITPQEEYLRVNYLAIERLKELFQEAMKIVMNKITYYEKRL